ASRVRVIPNGVDTEKFRPPSADERRAFRQSLGFPENDPVALYMGRWAAGKGVDTLLAAWREAANQAGFRWRLCLVVDRDPTFAEKSEIDQSGKRIICFRRTTEPLGYYQASDAAVLLSDNEGLSNFLLEAMACGLPLLTTPAAAVEEPGRFESYGWLTPPRDPGRLVERLLTFQTERAKLQEKGANARQVAEERFSIRATARDYEKLYLEMNESL
ncbi:MAG TPA: glycosyltransferase family 4 protein, partial [Elusimicrobiota bacterium]|nr:glycosyltransferase family 4 protein [Elusimicrobiota bacterium]